MQTNVAEIRRSLEMASKMAKAMIDFVPIPVKNAEHKEALLMMMEEATQEIIEMVEREEAENESK